MNSSGVDLDKIERMAGLAFENCMRLHFDSIILFFNKAYSSAYFLSVLSLEEFGKVFLITDFLYHSRVDDRMDEEWEEKFLQLIFSHTRKQSEFTRISEFNLPKDFINTVYKGKLELKKQNSVYVGLPKKRGKIDLKGRINNPLKVSREKTRRQITVVNDCLLEMVLGKIKGQYIIDSDVVEDLMTKSLYFQIRSKWEYTSPRVIKRLKLLERLEDAPE